VFGQAGEKPWIRITNEVKWGSLTEPLTLIKTPVGSVTMIMPNDSAVGGFKEVVLRYDEKPIVSLVDADCEDFTILYSRPDNDGTFRYLTRTSRAMNDQERKTYCAYDWTHEREALRAEFLRQTATEKQ
jgi:hypothetical protein